MGFGNGQFILHLHQQPVIKTRSKVWRSEWSTKMATRNQDTFPYPLHSSVKNHASNDSLQFKSWTEKKKHTCGEINHQATLTHIKFISSVLQFEFERTYLVPSYLWLWKSNDVTFEYNSLIDENLNSFESSRELRSLVVSRDCHGN